MSEPKRYHFVTNRFGESEMRPSDDCLKCSEMAEEQEYIRYEDYARLKAEVEQARKISGEGMSVTLDLNNQLCAENARLKAECQARQAENSVLAVECDSLKAEVERLKEDNRQLTKAFEIAEGIIKRMGKASEDAAKEGKSSV